jgi:transposase-like protein
VNTVHRWVDEIHAGELEDCAYPACVTVAAMDAQLKSPHPKSPHPRKAHMCSTPSTGLPGQRWTCPDCAYEWWADEVESADGVFITWERS